MQQDVYVHLFGRPLAAHLLYHHSSCDGVTIAHDSQSTAGSLIMANQQKSFVLDENDKFFICGELAVLIVGSGAAGDERYAKQFMRRAVDDIMEMPGELDFT